MKILGFIFRRVVLFALLGIAIKGNIAAQDLQSKLPSDPEVATGKLANGLTYYIRNNHKPENKVELRLAVKAGSIYENDDQQGLAHFMEHMNFNGTKNFQRNDLVSYLQSIGVEFGADLNAYTSFDRTIYILPIPTDKPGNLEKGFQIIEDWAHNALLTEKDIDEERGVVLEESRLGKGADDRMLKKYFAKLAEGSVYGERLPIGKDDILKTFKYQAIRSFYHDWYRPDRQAVIIVGDIDTATAKKMLMQHFAGLKNPENERSPKPVVIKPRTAPEAMVCTDKEAERTSLSITFPNQKKHSETKLEDYRHNLESSLVQEVLNRRLTDLSHGSNPPFPYAYASYSGWVQGYSNFSVYTSFGADGPEKAINAVTAEIMKAKKFGFNESETDLAKKQMMSMIEKFHNEKNTTESSNYVEEYLRAFMDGEAFPGIDNEYNYYKSMLPGIKVEDLNSMLREWLSSTNTFTLITAPDKSDMKLPADAALLEMTKKGFSQEITRNEEKKIAASLMETKPTPGKVIASNKEDGFDATTYTLSNGIKITIKPTTFKSDEILMNGVKKGGINNYGVKDLNDVQMATNIVKAMGVGAFEPNDLEKVLSGKEIKVETEIGELNDKVTASSNIKDFESMLQLTYLYIMQPRRDEGLFKAYKDRQKMQLQFLMSNPQYAFYDTTIKTLYNNNPLARKVIPLPSDFDNLDLNRVMEIYKNEISCADGYHFFIVGNINPETAIPMLETYLGSLPVKNTNPKSGDNGVRPIAGIKELKIKKGKEKQSMIIGIYHGEAHWSEDLNLKTMALAEVLNIKVIEDLREKMGAIYTGGFAGGVEKEPYEHYTIQFYLPCGPENVDKLIAAAKDEIRKMKENPPDAKDVDKVKSQWREKHLTEMKENKYWADKMEDVLFLGRDKDRAINYQDYVDKLTPIDLQQTANKLFNAKNEFIAILYPES